MLPGIMRVLLNFSRAEFIGFRNTVGFIRSVTGFLLEFVQKDLENVPLSSVEQYFKLYSKYYLYLPT